MLEKRKKGSVITARRGSQTVTRNSSHFERSSRFGTSSEMGKQCIDVGTDTEQPNNTTAAHTDMTPQITLSQHPHEAHTPDVDLRRSEVCQISSDYVVN